MRKFFLKTGNQDDYNMFSILRMPFTKIDGAFSRKTVIDWLVNRRDLDRKNASEMAIIETEIGKIGDLPISLKSFTQLSFESLSLLWKYRNFQSSGISRLEVAIDLKLDEMAPTAFGQYIDNLLTWNNNKIDLQLNNIRYQREILSSEARVKRNEGWGFFKRVSISERAEAVRRIDAFLAEKQISLVAEDLKTLRNENTDGLLALEQGLHWHASFSHKFRRFDEYSPVANSVSEFRKKRANDLMNSKATLMRMIRGASSEPQIDEIFSKYFSG